MTSNGLHGNWPRNYTQSKIYSNSAGPASPSPWNQTSATTIRNPPALSAGYVHSGYQAAIQGSWLQSNPSSQPSFVPQSSHLMQNDTVNIPNDFMRPPRLGPGGPVRCSYPGCEYSGFAKSVEIHRMDRHLIFPPGYKPPKSVPDADLGPNVTVPGTGISLNTPDAIEAWIAERRKNWPTTARIAEKQKRKAEAIERGQLEQTPNKRARIDGSSSFDDKYAYSRGMGKGRGIRGGHRGRGRGVGAVSLVSQMPAALRAPTPRPTFRLPEKPGGQMANGVTEVDAKSDSNSDSDSVSDIDPLLDVTSSKIEPPEVQDMENEVETEQPHTRTKGTAIKAHKRKQPKQPIPKPYNPLVDRPSFLRRLLQPEIRHTVSNLSQAVRFIVDNDMFQGVELKPGDADDLLIMEIGPESDNCDSSRSPNI